MSGVRPIALAVLLATPSTVLAATPTPFYKSAQPHLFIRASRAQTLYDQTGGDSGAGMNSQNFESALDAYDDQAADDFIVPDGVRWKILEVDVIGNYFGGEGDADSMNVVLYKNRHGKPGRIVAEFDNLLDPGDGWGTFAFDLGKGVKLRPGHYWMSIQANQVFDTDGRWGWDATDSVANSPAVWRNPGGAFGIGCTEWTVETSCLSDSGLGDHLFALKGRIR